MMTHAYQEIYLNSIQNRIGLAFDFAINDCGINKNDFINLFLASSVSKNLENGNIFMVLGRSGYEIVYDIIYEIKKYEIGFEPISKFERTIEYWIGYAISYYQWYTNRKFKEIFDVLSFDDLEKMYYTLHEADISKFVEIVNDLIINKYPETNLKRFRIMNGLSQKELSIKSNVSLRSIQMYEQRNKDINKASLETIYMLSKALNCNIEDLVEK